MRARRRALRLYLCFMLLMAGRVCEVEGNG